jgi:hypothetical protein
MEMREAGVWRIHYSDEITYISDDGAWKDAPAFAAQVVGQADPTVGRVLLHGGDYFWCDCGRCYSGDVAGVYGYLVTTGVLLTKAPPGSHAWIDDGHRCQGDVFHLLDFLTQSGLVKLGQHLPHGVFAKIYNQAASDPGLPAKSAYHPKEVRGPWVNL